MEVFSPVKLNTEVMLLFHKNYFFIWKISLFGELKQWCHKWMHCCVVWNKWILKECKAVDLHCFATWAKEKKICSSKLSFDSESPKPIQTPNWLKSFLPVFTQLFTFVVPCTPLVFHDHVLFSKHVFRMH